jgi:predicted outer membrane protein
MGISNRVSPYRRLEVNRRKLDIPIDFDDSEYDDNKSMKQKRNEYLERYIRDTCDECDIEDAFERKRKLFRR